METLVISILWIVAAINLILGFVIFSRGLMNPRNALFGLIAFATALWSFAIIAFYTPEFFGIANWLVFTHLSALCVAFFFYCFSFLFPKPLGTQNLPLTFGLLFFLAAIFLVLQGLVVGEPVANQTEYLLGGYYFIYAIILMLMFVSGYIFLFWQLKRHDDANSREQIKYVLAGSLISSSLAIVPDLVMPYLGNFDYTWLGPLFTFIMVFSLFIAMAKHHLFNAKVIFTELFSGLIIFALFIELLLAKTTFDVLVKAAVLCLITIVSYLLIRGVYREVEQREKIESLAGQLQNFIHFLSHEIKGILGKNKAYFAAVLEGDFGVMPNEILPVTKQALKDTDASVDMVVNILRSSDLKNGKLTMNKTSFDLKTEIAKLLERFKTEVEEKGLKFEAKLEDGNFTISGDQENLVSHVFKNLLANTLTYTPSGSIEVGLKRTGDKIIFYTKDTGIGLSTKTKTNLFTEGGKGEEALKTNVHSTGYGLYFAKGIVDAHGGRIWAESDGPGQGSIFSVELPSSN